MRPHTKFLISLLQGRRIKYAAEIGVFKGDNAEGLLESLDIECLIGVDPYMRYPEFDKNLARPKGVVAKADLEQVRIDMLARMEKFGSHFFLARSFSVPTAKKFPDGHFDFVFIDGNHYYNYVYADIKAWLPKVKVGGILAGHDYVDRPKIGVIPAVQELLPPLTEINLGAKVWYYEKE